MLTLFSAVQRPAAQYFLIGESRANAGRHPRTLRSTQMHSRDRYERLRQLTSSEVGGWIDSSASPQPIVRHK